jgi:hypothetical protein
MPATNVLAPATIITRAAVTLLELHAFLIGCPLFLSRNSGTRLKLSINIRIEPPDGCQSIAPPNLLCERQLSALVNIGNGVNLTAFAMSGLGPIYRKNQTLFTHHERQIQFEPSVDRARLARPFFGARAVRNRSKHRGLSAPTHSQQSVRLIEYFFKPAACAICGTT